MSQLTILSDVELDAVCGGLLNAGDGGAGGAGGQAVQGGNISDVRGFIPVIAGNDQSVNNSGNSANGGAGGRGGDVTILGFHR